MNKSLTRSEYLMSFLFIFMLICVVAAFFFGYDVGSDRTKVRYEAKLAQNNEQPQELTAYHQQYLVSFYHSVYAPYDEFRKQWFNFRESLETGGAAAGNPAKSLQELSKSANQIYEKMMTFSVPPSSPALQEAQNLYLKSLKLFEQASGERQSKSNGLQPSALLAALDSDSYIQQAIQYGLDAQSQYFEAILKWNESVQPVPGQELLSSSNLPISDWGKLNLNAKNKYVSAMMSENKWFLPVQTMDLVARMDEMIASGQAQKLGLTETKPLAELIVQTGAVREGDFAKTKEKFYAQQTLPQLPFFFGSN
ncbi:hypothetical protein ACFQWB_10875 [Paenibacillus thermoaerophilus]|uniref:Uncharacterized protein n=1 Tax=Paenibacillus thermoaerophilus TaxID=1215385 RepID=A0ABW2V6N7_9BACL|nr:hypothetical protein [Paenibacillus thermoaerophilus]TMV18735.1 hypothetical protein FE781_02020 [Paenibacillus thermoaerophilus]